MAINGTAVGVASVGGLLLYSAVKGAGIGDTARSLLAGKGVAGLSATGTQPDGSQMGTSALENLLLSPSTTIPPNPDTSSSTAERALSFAIAQVGKPYKWGAIGPNAYDCSGLVYAAYRAAGAKIPRLTTASIMLSSKFVPVPKDWSQIQSGDLILPDPGHIVFVIDPSTHEIVEAPHTGANVRETNYSEFKGMFAVRRYRGN